MTTASPPPTKDSLFLIFVIAFLNTVGATIVFPVLPFITQRYVHDPAIVAIWIGVLVSTYSLCALISAPALGALSDRVGRKPVLVVSLIGSAIGYVAFGIGGALWVLLLGRVIDGLTAGDSSAMFGYLADISDPEERAKRFGLAGAISGIGFMVGPALGGLLAHFGLSAPVYVAAGFSLVTALISLFILPESLTAENRSASFALPDLHPLKGIGEALSRPELRPLLLGILLLGIPMTGAQTNMSLLAKDALAWGPTQIGLLISGVGIVDIVVQGGLLGLMLPRIGERGVVYVGLIGQGIGYAALAVVGAFLPLPWLFVAGGLLFAASEGATQPALHGLLSRSVSDSEQGWLAGGMTSIDSLTRLVGPLLIGFLYSGLGHAAPYVLGVGVIVVVLVLALPLLHEPAGREGSK